MTAGLIDRLVVAIDGSELSREAFEYAALLAESVSLPIRLLHVIEHVAPTGMALPSSSRRLDRAREVMTSATLYCRWRGIECSKYVVEGALIPLLVEHSTARDLICVGMKGRFQKVGFGSTTRWLVTHAPCPVMVVSGPPHRPVNRLIGVFDGSDGSKRAVNVASYLSRQAGWPQTVLAVHRENSDLSDVLERANALAPESHVIAHAPTGRSEAKEIEEVAAAARHAMLVVGAYTDSWMHQLLFGGMTGHHLTHLNAPMVIVR